MNSPFNYSLVISSKFYTKYSNFDLPVLKYKEIKVVI